ncbi:MAG: YHS domain-containing protein [Desulfatiglandaceae bacterium]
MLVRLIFLGAVAWFLFRIVRKLLAAGTRDSSGSSPPRGSVDEMVQDPVCGTYVPVREAYRRVIDGKAYYFCSERCADLFEEQRGRR